MTELDDAHRRREAYRAEAERRCVVQRALIEQMKAAGEDTAEAEGLLVQFEQTLALMIHAGKEDEGRS